MAPPLLSVRNSICICSCISSAVFYFEMSGLIFIAHKFINPNPFFWASWIPRKILTIKPCLKVLLKISFIKFLCHCYLSPETTSICQTRHLRPPVQRIKLKVILPKGKHSNKNFRTRDLCVAPTLTYEVLSVRPESSFCIEYQPIT